MVRNINKSLAFIIEIHVGHQHHAIECLDVVAYTITKKLEQQ